MKRTASGKNGVVSSPHPGKLNSIEPKKCPLSSMAPTILFKDGRPHVALGSAGGPRIISSVAQTIINVVEFGMKLRKAVAPPRFHCQRGTIILERTYVGTADPRRDGIALAF